VKVERSVNLKWETEVEGRKWKREVGRGMRSEKGSLRWWHVKWKWKGKWESPE
jgi:hypothetical protein